ncbi:MAG: T9SS type A sorting domain-containing protein [Saprospiraceae bacterium]|nr:T9SS type A sorting domain-containing protein [Saprospiraceae bacterium]
MARIWILIVFIYVVAVSTLYSQPNCQDVNLGLNQFGQAVFSMADLIPLGGQPDGGKISIHTQNEELIYGPVEVDYFEPIFFDACKYADQSVKITVDTDNGDCWSMATFKKTFGPVIAGRKFDVYCFDPLVDEPQDDGPNVIFSCYSGPTTEVDYVADWVTVLECDPNGQDTAKIIYREWEKFDKDGLRGTSFDTIYVFNLPEITAENIFCQSRDTIYCSNPGDIKGPYFVYPEVPGQASPCDTMYLLEFDQDDDGYIQITNTKFEDKCGLGSKASVWDFDAECEDQYKIVLDLKQECFGIGQTNCTVSPIAGTPPNGMQNQAPGYWRCTFWLVDLDTVPPEIHCKYPLLFQGEFEPDNWVTSTDGDGYVDTLWAPYNLTIVGNNDQSGPTTHCMTASKDTTITFAWRYRSENSGASYDPFGFSLNGKYFQLTDDGSGVIGDEGAVRQVGYKIVDLKVGDEFCFVQESNDGCCGRAQTTIKPLTVVSTGGRDCAAHAYLPRVQVEDDWSGVKAVKARIEGIGTYVLEYDAEDDCYLTHDQPKLPYSVDPYEIVYSAFDSCHNISLDTCYILVKDAVRPVPHIDKGLTVSITDKKVWLPAEDFDEGTYDNCGMNLFLARRADWYESCIDLCNDLDTLCVNEHHEVLWKAYLEKDKKIDEVEAHYSSTLDWLSSDGQACANLIYNAWQYDLIKYANLHCDKHKYPLTPHNVHELIADCYDAVEDCFLPVYNHPDPLETPNETNSPTDFRLDDRYLELYDQLGGGWSKEVPFDCADACSEVTVEVLAMDFWCNWSTAWTKVWVEDKVPPVVVQDVKDGEISCRSFRAKEFDVRGQDHPISIEEIVDLAKGDDQRAYDALDDIFGGYEKVWQGQYGYVDINGNPIQDSIPFWDSTCYCRVKEIVRTRLYDDHTSQYYWKNDTIHECGYDAKKVWFQQGQVLINCPNYIGCDQEIWCDIDHCGEGYLYRKFKIWSGCPPDFYENENVPDSLLARHQPDTIKRLQVIKIYNECALSPYQFDRPLSTQVEDCGLVIDEAGNAAGAAHPDHTGWLRYQFDDDCRLVGIDYEDKVFNIVGGDGNCYKIERTWYFMDWCEGQPTTDQWWKDETSTIGKHVQHILLTDTVPPVCEIEGPVEEGGVIEVGACAYRLSVDVNVEDACGLSSYYWEVKELKGSVSTIADFGQGQLNSEASERFSITTGELVQGIYKLKVRVVDDCANESYCEYNFTVQQVKKPTPICVLSVTAKLTPMDLNQDGLIDTAMTTVWAREFDRSSTPACEDNDLSYRIEFLDGIDDDTWTEDDGGIDLGCNHVGTQMVRLWVFSLPSGTVDYCDVILQVQGPDEGCPTTRTTSGLDVHPHFAQGEGNVTGIALKQNVPNPFDDATIIEFELSDDAELHLSVIGIDGKVVHHQKGHYRAGKNRVELTAQEVPAPGIYYYRIESRGVTQTRRMVRLQ